MAKSKNNLVWLVVSAIALTLAVSAASASGTLVLKTKDGGVTTVPDFTARHTSQDMPGGPLYVLVPDRLDGTLAYQVQFLKGTSEITIGIFKKPFGATRKTAEGTLRKFFPLPNALLCRLKIEVLIPGPVDRQLSAQNLGLSFCPGSVRLR
jgi:hypothetical protein